MQLKYLPLLLMLGLTACGADDSTSTPPEQTKPAAQDTMPPPGQNTLPPGQTPVGFSSTQKTPANPAFAPEVLLPTDLPKDTVLQDLGLIHDENGVLPTLSFNIPANVYSVTLLVYGSEDSVLYLNSLTNPIGNIWANMTDALGPFDDLIRVMASDQILPIPLPNTPDAPFTPGTYKVTLGAGSYDAKGRFNRYNQTLSLALLVRYGKTVPTKGFMDLTLHFTGAQNLTAATAKNNATLNKAIEQFKTIYKQANIEIGSIYYEDVNDQSLQAIMLSGESCEQKGDYQDLMQHSVDGNHQSLHLFFVDHFMCLSDKNVALAVAGIASTISGVPTNGSIYSGVAIAWGLFKNQQSTLIANVMAHETGHFLGLYHAQESEDFAASLSVESVYDTIADTLNTPEVAEKNLMYWAASADNIQLSAGQGWVLRTHSWVHQ